MDSPILPLSSSSQQRKTRTEPRHKLTSREKYKWKDKMKLTLIESALVLVLAGTASLAQRNYRCRVESEGLKSQLLVP